LWQSRHPKIHPTYLTSEVSIEAKRGLVEVGDSLMFDKKGKSIVDSTTAAILPTKNLANQASSSVIAVFAGFLGRDMMICS